MDGNDLLSAALDECGIDFEDMQEQVSGLSLNYDLIVFNYIIFRQMKHHDYRFYRILHFRPTLK